jgi:thiol:disulfide interchange protein DsbD
MLTYDESPAELVATSHQGMDWYLIDANIKDERPFLDVLKKAKAEKRPVLIDFYADWCVACRQLELITLQDEAILRVLQHYKLIRIDATKSSELVTKIQNRYGVMGLPTMILIDEEGTVQADPIIGFIHPKDLLPLLKFTPSS